MQIFSTPQKQVIGVDCGRNECKFVTKGNKVKFRAAVGESNILNLQAGGNYEVSINGKKSFIADLAVKESRTKRFKTTINKIHEETKILILTGLAMVATEESPKIVIAVPIKQYNDGTKMRFVDLLQGEYTVSINKKQEVKLSLYGVNIQISPEGGAGIWTMFLDDEGKYVDHWAANDRFRFIDWGSKTTNYGVLDDKDYINTQSDTIDKGLYELTHNIAKGKEPTPDQYRDFVSFIISALSNDWQDLDAENDIIMNLGGGIFKLEKYIREEFKRTIIIEDPLWATAIGCYRLGLAT